MLKEVEINLDERKRQECRDEIAKEKEINKLMSYVSEILESGSNRIFINFSEKDIELLCYTILRGTLKFRTYVEYPSNLGYIDIYINGNEPYMDKDMIIELKYIKKSEYSESLLKERIEKGKEQLQEYSKDERLKCPVKYLVVFVGEEIKLLEKVR